MDKKHFIESKTIEKLVLYGEFIKKYASILDSPDIVVSEMEFTRMREDISHYIGVVNSLSLTELDLIIEDDFFKGSVKSYIVRLYDGPINRLIPMYIKIPRVILGNLGGDVLCDTMTYHTFMEFSKIGGMGLFDRNVRKLRSEYFKNLFKNLEIIDAHARVMEVLGSRNVSSRDLFAVYRTSLWKCMSLDRDRAIIY